MGGLYNSSGHTWAVDESDRFLTICYYQFTSGGTKFDTLPTDKLVGPVELVKWEK